MNNSIESMGSDIKTKTTFQPTIVKLSSFLTAGMFFCFRFIASFVGYFKLNIVI